MPARPTAAAAGDPPARRRRLPRWAGPLADPNLHLILIGLGVAALAAAFRAIAE